MPVSIAGMHRSGTSMVARLLNLCGLDLGPADRFIQPAADNPEGFWESLSFFEINELLLRELGGKWDGPPDLAPGWEHSDGFAGPRARAAALPAVLGLKEPWGWKDPRNSLTLPFWRTVWPDLRVVVCVRHPLEVAFSLWERNGIGIARSLRLWQAYHASLLEADPARLVVCHYDAFFADPAAELYRIAHLLGLAPSDDALRTACATIAPRLRHSRVGAEDFALVDAPAAVVEAYGRLCELAGPVFARPDEHAGDGATVRRLARLAVSAGELVDQQAESIRKLEQRVADLSLGLSVAEHELRVARAVGEERDWWVRVYEQRLASRRHRYADNLAELVLKVTRPGRRRASDAPGPGESSRGDPG